MNEIQAPEEKTRHYSLWLLPIGMLFLAFLDLPYGYYMLLRFVVCGCCGYIAYTEYLAKEKATKWVIIFGGIALLFNPLIPIHLGRESWTIIDPIIAALLIVHFVIQYRNAAKKRKNLIQENNGRH